MAKVKLDEDQEIEALIEEAQDVIKELEDKARWWTRLIHDREVEGKGNYAGVNIGSEDVGTILRHRAVIVKLIEKL